LANLGIFGGTFNPVHYGHLINAEWIRESCSLEKLVFVPSKVPVHKDLAGDVSTEHRCRMVELAVSGNENLGVSDIEIRREGPSYTIYTVRGIMAEHPGAHIHLVIGEDSYNEIETWKDYRDLLGLVTLVVMRRGAAPGRRRTDLAGGTVIFADNPVIDISSTDVRARIRRGLSVRYLLPEDVRRYIIETGLYRA